MVAILVVAIPVAVIMTGAVVAFALGQLTTVTVERDHAGSELVDLNV